MTPRMRERIVLYGQTIFFDGTHGIDNKKYVVHSSLLFAF